MSLTKIRHKWFQFTRDLFTSSSTFLMLLMLQWHWQNMVGNHWRLLVLSSKESWLQRKFLTNICNKKTVNSDELDLKMLQYSTIWNIIHRLSTFLLDPWICCTKAHMHLQFSFSSPILHPLECWMLNNKAVLCSQI